MGALPDEEAGAGEPGLGDVGDLPRAGGCEVPGGRVEFTGMGAWGGIPTLWRTSHLTIRQKKLIKQRDNKPSPPGHWQQLRFKGDWMLRPITTNEIGWLARALVAVSRAVNSYLNLDGVPLADKASSGTPQQQQQQQQQQSGSTPQKQTPPQASPSGTGTKTGTPGRSPAAGTPQQQQQQQPYDPPETLLQEWLLVARRRGWRVNLRPLAEKQTLAWLLAAALLVHWIARWLLTPAPPAAARGGSWWEAAAAAYEEQQRLYAEEQARYQQQQRAHRLQQHQQRAAQRAQQWEEVDMGGAGDLGGW